MTDYNDGLWHGWNGGECPVHPDSVVDVAHADRGVVCGETAEQFFWSGENCRIIAFRVITPYQAPREFWAVGMHLYETRVGAERFCTALDRDYPGQGYGDTSRIIKLVEVKE